MYYTVQKIKLDEIQWRHDDVTTLVSRHFGCKLLRLENLLFLFTLPLSIYDFLAQL